MSNQNEPYPYVERRVKTIVSHPLFDPKTFEYDLALLKFAEPIRYERNILPVCVPSGNDSYVDRIATVIGWGRLYEGECCGSANDITINNELLLIYHFYSLLRWPLT